VLALVLLALVVATCGGLTHRAESAPTAGEPRTQADAGDSDIDALDEEERVFEDGATASADLEEEEEVHEDPAALDRLISKLTASEPAPASAGPEPAAPAPGQEPIPVAYDLWQLEDDECLDRLAALGVHTRKPTCDTTLVKTPVLLDGPVEGVTIRPRWQRSDGVNAVIDCRLALALVAVAREVKRRGVREVLFYSTYRPLKRPPEECPEGKAGAACKEAWRKYEQALGQKHSQHRRGLAIDIRWFVTEDGDTIDVLEHYEREDKQPPCDGEPATEAGRFLKELACALHDQRVFNVILTPNANKAHHNHFHFDITPDAKWYVIK